MSMTISDFKSMALDAMQKFGEDSVLQVSSNSKLGFGKDCVRAVHAQRLGSRTSEYKAKNMETRQALVDALSKELGGLSLKSIPPTLAKVMKVADFKLGEDGKVLSCKPLTARRIVAIANALQLSQEERACFDELGRLDHGDEVSQFDKVAMAKVLPPGFKAVDVNRADEAPKAKGKMAEAKPWHAHAALDLLPELKKANVKLPYLSLGAKPLDVFVEDFAWATSKKIFETLNEVQSGKSRYGKHEVALPDWSIIVEATLRTMMAQQPKLEACIKSQDPGKISELGGKFEQRRDDARLQMDDNGISKDDKAWLSDECGRCTVKSILYNTMNSIIRRFKAEGA